MRPPHRGGPSLLRARARCSRARRDGTSLDSRVRRSPARRPSRSVRRRSAIDDPESAANALRERRAGSRPVAPRTRASRARSRGSRCRSVSGSRSTGRSAGLAARRSRARCRSRARSFTRRHGATDPAQPCVGAGRTGYAPFMTDTPQEEQLEPDELEGTNGEPLPDREAMSTIPIGDPIGGFTVGPGPDEI